MPFPVAGGGVETADPCFECFPQRFPPALGVAVASKTPERTAAEDEIADFHCAPWRNELDSVYVSVDADEMRVTTWSICTAGQYW